MARTKCEKTDRDGSDRRGTGRSWTSGGGKETRRRVECVYARNRDVVCMIYIADFRRRRFSRRAHHDDVFFFSVSFVFISRPGSVIGPVVAYTYARARRTTRSLVGWKSFYRTKNVQTRYTRLGDMYL